MPVYKIAGYNVKIDAVYDRTKDNLKKYETDEPHYCADFSDNAKSLTIEFHKQYPHMPMDSCEYMVLGALFYRELLNHQGFMLHSSAVVYHNKAYLFSAPSGTGKSTHTSLWKQYLGDDAKILNDDKPALVYENGSVFVYGTPFSGKTDLNLNEKYPLGGVCYLSRSESCSICQMTVKEALPKVMEQTMRNLSPEYTDKLMEVLNIMLPLIPYYALSCDMSKQAFLTSFEKLTGEDYE